MDDCTQFRALGFLGVGTLTVCLMTLVLTIAPVPTDRADAAPPSFAAQASAEALADFDARLVSDLRAAFREVEFRLIALQASVERLEASGAAAEQMLAERASEED